MDSVGRAVVSAGQRRAGGEGNGLLAFPPGVQFLEQPHVQNTQNRDDAAQKDN